MRSLKDLHSFSSGYLIIRREILIEHYFDIFKIDLDPGILLLGVRDN